MSSSTLTNSVSKQAPGTDCQSLSKLTRTLNKTLKNRQITGKSTFGGLSNYTIQSGGGGGGGGLRGEYSYEVYALLVMLP